MAGRAGASMQVEGQAAHRAAGAKARRAREAERVGSRRPSRPGSARRGCPHPPRSPCTPPPSRSRGAAGGRPPRQRRVLQVRPGREVCRRTVEFKVTFSHAARWVILVSTPMLFSFILDDFWCKWLSHYHFLSFEPSYFYVSRVPITTSNWAIFAKR